MHPEGRALTGARSLRRSGLRPRRLRAGGHVCSAGEASDAKIKSRRGRSPDLRQLWFRNYRRSLDREAATAAAGRLGVGVADGELRAVQAFDVVDRGAHQVLQAQRVDQQDHAVGVDRSEEHTSELQSLMRNSYAVFCLKKKKKKRTNKTETTLKKK